MKEGERESEIQKERERASQYAKKVPNNAKKIEVQSQKTRPPTFLIRVFEL